MSVQPAFDADWLRPDWVAAGAASLMTTRNGGVSAAPFDSMNVRTAVGDDPACVAENRRRLAAALTAAAGRAVDAVYLDQMHGARVVRLTRTDLARGEPWQADASITTEHGIACTAQVADCLPVLFAAPGGVGAAHAGWRGLAAGVLESTVAALCAATGCEPAQLQAWLGPCIGPLRFEVGADVLQAFGADVTGSAASTAFVGRAPPLGPGKWLADLPLLARQRLAAAGVSAVGGGGWCTVDDASRFFSYRRSAVTGRMVAAVCRSV